MQIPMTISPNVCRICEATMRSWSEEWLGYPWGTCTNCGSVQKLISKAQFENLSPSYDPGFLENSTDIEALKESMGVEEKYQLLRRLLGSNSHGSLLDIGCGMGGFLLAGAKMGMVVSGVEPSLSHSKAAVEIFGLNVASRYFKSDDFDEKFDVVVLSHVIEHILEPAAFLADVMQVLQPGGRLILITPNCGSLGAIICGKYWSMYKPVDHVTMFTKDAIKFATPEGSAIEKLRTSEWPGEFAAHVISGFKTALKPALSNTACRGEKGSIRQSSLGPITRSILAIVSLPFYISGWAFDRQSCIYTVVQKRIQA